MTAWRSVARGLFESAVEVLPTRRRPGDRLILSYHNVVRDGCVVRGDTSLHLPLSRFREQLRAVSDVADIVTLSDLLNVEVTDRVRVAITFDDAYAGALTLGVPACDAVGAPCVVFVAPSLLGCVPPWDDLASRGAWTDADRHRFLTVGQGRASSTSVAASADDPCRIASERELESMLSSSAAVTLGNHTRTHANLSALSGEEALAEIEGAAFWLRDRFAERSTRAIAYPYGLAPSTAVLSELRAAGLVGLMNAGGWISTGVPVPIERVPRWNVPAGLSPRGFRLRMRGLLIERFRNEAVS